MGDPNAYSKTLAWLFYDNNSTWIGAGVYSDPTTSYGGHPAFENGSNGSWTIWYWPSLTMSGNSSARITAEDFKGDYTLNYYWGGAAYHQAYTFSDPNTIIPASQADVGVEQESSENSTYSPVYVTAWQWHDAQTNTWNVANNSFNGAWGQGSPTMQITGDADNNGQVELQSVGWP